MKINNMIVMHKMNPSGQVDERIVASVENVEYFKTQGYINTEENPATAGQKVVSTPKVFPAVVPYIAPVVVTKKQPLTWYKRLWRFLGGSK